MNINIDLVDLIALGTLAIGLVAFGLAYLYQEFWYKKRNHYDIHKGKWVKNK